MAEAPRFNIVLLLIAAANLATDVTRLTLEWSPSRGLHNAFRAQSNTTGHQGYYASAPEQLREKAPAPERLRALTSPGEHIPPRGMLPRANGSVPFSRRPDFSFRCPPSCCACRYQPACWSDRRRLYG
jgi:hypothetical protein